MAQYKEKWKSPIDDEIVGYLKTETNAYIPLDPANKDYQDFLTWQSGGGVADPAYTAEEIAAYQAEQDLTAAKAYLSETDGLVQRYRDDVAAGRRPFVPESKYKNLLKIRARAQKLLSKEYADF
jgi:hypothetical protein